MLLLFKIKAPPAFYSLHTPLLSPQTHTLNMFFCVCLCALCCVCWSITAVWRGWGRRASRHVPASTYWLHPCFTEPSNKSLLMTQRRRGRGKIPGREEEEKVEEEEIGRRRAGKGRGEWEEEKEGAGRLFGANFLLSGCFCFLSSLVMTLYFGPADTRTQTNRRKRWFPVSDGGFWIYFLFWVFSLFFFSLLFFKQRRVWSVWLQKTHLQGCS